MTSPYPPTRKLFTGRSASDAKEDLDYPDAEPYLRATLHIPPGVPINLDVIPDPPKGQRPHAYLESLVQLAIYGSARKKLTLRQIQDAIAERFEFYRTCDTWKGSIRHMLSLKSIFVATQRPPSEPGRGSYWHLDVSVTTKHKRPRKRGPGKKTAVSPYPRSRKADTSDQDTSSEPSDASSQRSQAESPLSSSQRILPFDSFIRDSSSEDEKNDAILFGGVYPSSYKDEVSIRYGMGYKSPHQPQTHTEAQGLNTWGPLAASNSDCFLGGTLISQHSLGIHRSLFHPSVASQQGQSYQCGFNPEDLLFD